MIQTAMDAIAHRNLVLIMLLVSRIQVMFIHANAVVRTLLGTTVRMNLVIRALVCMAVTVTRTLMGVQHAYVRVSGQVRTVTISTSA